MQTPLTQICDPEQSAFVLHPGPTMGKLGTKFEKCDVSAETCVASTTVVVRVVNDVLPTGAVSMTMPDEVFPDGSSAGSYVRVTFAGAENCWPSGPKVNA